MTPVTLAGVAASYDVLFLGSPFPAPMIIRPGSFTQTLATDELMVVALVNHAGMPLASTLSPDAPLTLADSDTGLLYEATVNTDDADAALLVSKVRQGLVAEASVDVTIVQAEWIHLVHPLTEAWGENALEITELDIHRGDVTFTARGANPETTTRVVSSQTLTQQVANTKAVIRGLEYVLAEGAGGSRAYRI